MGASLFWGISTPVHGATECQYGLKEVEMYRRDPHHQHVGVHGPAAGLAALAAVGAVT